MIKHAKTKFVRYDSRDTTLERRHIHDFDNNDKNLE